MTMVGGVAYSSVQETSEKTIRIWAFRAYLDPDIDVFQQQDISSTGPTLAGISFD